MFVLTFKRYAYRHDTYGYKRNFKVYEAEKFDEDRKEKSKCIDQKRKCQKDLYQSTMGIFQGKSKNKPFKY